MVYDITFNTKENIENQISYIKAAANKTLKKKKSCDIEVSKDRNLLQIPVQINLIFRINEMECERIELYHIGKIDNYLFFKSLDIDVDQDICDAMHSLPVFYKFDL